MYDRLRIFEKQQSCSHLPQVIWEDMICQYPNVVRVQYEYTMYVQYIKSTPTYTVRVSGTARVPESSRVHYTVKSKGFMRDWMRRLWNPKTETCVHVCTTYLVRHIVRVHEGNVFRLPLGLAWWWVRVSANGNETMAGGIPVPVDMMIA
jgi:hypothetical protein